MTSNLDRCIIRLNELLGSENQALKRLDFSSATALSAEKVSAINDLEKLDQSSLSTPFTAKICKRMNDLAVENQILLGRAIEVQSRLLRIVARSVAPQPLAQGYGTLTPRPRSSPLALLTRA